MYDDKLKTDRTPNKIDVAANAKRTEELRREALSDCLDEMKSYKDMQAVCREGSLIMDAENRMKAYWMSGLGNYVPANAGSSRVKIILNDGKAMMAYV